MSSSMFNNNTHNFLMYVILGYSTNPNKIDKQNYKLFFDTVINVLQPNTYNNLLKKYVESNPIDDTVLENRTTFSKWFAKLMLNSLLVDSKSVDEKKMIEQEVLNKFVIMSDSVDPKIWGRIAWAFLLEIINYYVLENREKYKIILTYLQYVLPCKDCRKNFANELLHSPINETTLMNKESLIVWYARIKNNIHYRIMINKNTKSLTFIPELVGNVIYQPLHTSIVPVPTKHYTAKKTLDTPKPTILNTTVLSTPTKHVSAPIKLTLPVTKTMSRNYTSKVADPYANLKQKKSGGCNCGKGK